MGARFFLKIDMIFYRRTLFSLNFHDIPYENAIFFKIFRTLATRASFLKVFRIFRTGASFTSIFQDIPHENTIFLNYFKALSTIRNKFILNRINFNYI